MEIQIDSPTTEYHNTYDGPVGLQTRNGFVTELRIEDVGVATPRNVSGTQTDFVYGFSVESANTGEVFHYIFTVDASNVLFASIFDSQFQARAYYSIGKMAADLEPFSVAVNYNQIIVNSSSLPYPLWGFIGGTLVRADRVESINPDTPALTLFPGRVCSFADRFAWAYANQVIFNDPGTEPRTITAPNAISFGGSVLDLFQSGEGGSLIVVCTDATYAIPPDGLNGFQFQGVISRIPGYQGARSNNAATARGSTLGLVKDGIIDISSFRKRQLSNYRQRRRLTKPVGPDASGDYRNGTMLATDEGFIITINGKSCLLDLDSGKATWLYGNDAWLTGGGGDINIVGILKDADGKNIFVTETNVIDLFGNTDYTVTPRIAAPDPAGTTPDGSICVGVPSDPQMSPVVREISTSADRPGFLQRSYVRNSLQTATTPPPQLSLVINTSLWSATSQLREREMRSRRMQRAIRVDSPDVELTFTGGAVRIGESFDLVTKGIGRNRPSN